MTDLFEAETTNGRTWDVVKTASQPPSMECPHCLGTGRIPCSSMAERLGALRRQRGWSHSDLAAQCGDKITAGNIRQIEVGGNLNPKLNAVIALADALGVTVGYLVEGKTG
jgi:ribosome-binding protein aMBF1 (putative translation factor)